MRPLFLLRSLVFLSLLPTVAIADGPADNRIDEVRAIPPKGIKVDPASILQLTERCNAVRSQWGSLVSEAAKNAASQSSAANDVRSFASEVLVFPRAVELAIEFGQFYAPDELLQANKLLDEAHRRIGVAKQGGDWKQIVGFGDGQSRRLIVGGFESKIDGSYQPYGLVVPPGMTVCDPRPRRLDLWFHGRGEKLSEISFLNKQTASAGEYTPDDTLVLHPYGRYSNAFKFAGEIDVLEALDHIRDRLPVDPNRISVRGFSMGGAGCWQFATHYADRWFAANPGAGFSETPDFLQVFQDEDVRKSTPDYQQKLWRLYDCPPWAMNLAHCPTIAYSGEIDRQKQSADVMERAMEGIGIDLVHVIGPQTAHKIHPQSKRDIERKMKRLATAASVVMPRQVQFTTSTLRYHRMHWVDVQGLGKHWEPATVNAEIEGQSLIRVRTKNVTHLRFSFGTGHWPGATSGAVIVEIDGKRLIGPKVRSDRSWSWDIERVGKVWKSSKADKGLKKRPGLQGPIDDAFMSSFVFVLPSGKSDNKAFQAWVHAESEHAMLHWRKHFRGDVRKTLDTELTEAQIASSNLILFGDAKSNSVIKQITEKLPVKWTENEIEIGQQKVEQAGRAVAMIYPNPLNPKRYVVLNSGFTFREYDYLNNARQTPKLPDWALIDVREGPTTQSPGKVEAAGFFDETWQP